MQFVRQQKEKTEGIVDGDASECNHCKSKAAEVFQISGEYCLECWQTITHTNV